MNTHHKTPITSLLHRTTTAFSKMVRQHRVEILLIFFCVAAATLFVLLFSYSTSPLYSNYLTYGGEVSAGDSLQFQTIGKAWLDGAMPYRDAFDHKGPLLFFINMLGFLLGGGTRYGIVILQIICLSISLYYVIKISRLATASRSWGIFNVLIFLVFYSFAYIDGNGSQEYNLPFIIIPVYLALSYFSSENARQGKHNPIYALIYGLGAGASLMIQASNVVLICPCILVVGFTLIKNRQYKLLLQNLLYGAAGVAILTLPFVLYFALNGALPEMLYATIFFNFDYSQHIGSWLFDYIGINGEWLRYFILDYLPYFLIFPTILLAWRRKAYYIVSFTVISAVLETYLFFSTRAYWHYVICVLPQLPIFFNEFIQIRTHTEASKMLHCATLTIFVIIGYNQTMQLIGEVKDQRYDIQTAAGGYENIIEPHMDEIRSSSILTYGGNSLKSFNLRYGLPIAERYWIVQDWHASFSPQAQQEITQMFNDSQVEFILTDNGAQSYRPIINERYELIEGGEDTKYQLYRLKS